MQEEKKDKNLVKIERDFKRAHQAQAPAKQLMVEWEEFYFNDVQNTKSQLTEKQMDSIKSTYNIPISTKITFPIVEQILAFLTSMKPFPRLVGSQPEFGDMIGQLSKAYVAVWYESHAYQELRLAIRDMLLVGKGSVRVRPNTFYNESTFNTVVEYVNWRHIIVDPGSRREDMSDAEFMFILDVLPKEKAERVYDISISEEETIGTSNMEYDFNDYVQSSDIEYYGNDAKEDGKRKYVYVKEHFAKENVNLYISEKGDLSSIRPMPCEITNPEYTELESKLNEAKQQAAGSGGDVKEAKQTADNLAKEQPDYADVDAMENNIKDMGMAQATIQSGQSQSGEINDAVAQMEGQLSTIPKTIDGYRFYLTKDNFYECSTVDKIQRKQIRRTLVVGKRIIEREILPMDKYPIIFFTFNHLQSPNRVYGIPHYIQDLVKALNKYWSMLLYDMQTNGQRKVIFFEGTVAENSNVEERWAVPGAWIAIKADSSLPNGGMPQVIDPSPMNQSIQFIISSFKDLIEYIVGLFSINQGDPSQAPQTMGATMNIQSFGNQRVKLYTRNLERALEDLAYVTVCSLNTNAPKDKILKYIDPDGNEESVKLIDNSEDLQFKVRVDITNTMPTQRQMFAQLLSTVIAQTRNQGMSDLLTEQMLKMLDMPEASDVAKKIDVVQNLQSENASIQEEVQKLQGQIASLQNQIVLKDSKAKVDLAVEQAKGNVKANEAAQMEQINAQAATSTSMGEIPTELPVEQQAQQISQNNTPNEESIF